ncbi:MAG TPA: TPM domain-containing protein [Steroidobacteraceae bacterium]|nr:TPM domain-containing protein [Steroidobacteraceae bacterium]
MHLSRFFRHVFATRWRLRRCFPDSALTAIEQAISRTEVTHSGEIRFAIEVSLDPWEALRGREPRDRALEVFANLGVWDTESNNGVLIYVLLADQDVEIVADRGYNGRVTSEEWAEVCATMKQSFACARFEAGAVAAVERVGNLIAPHFPLQPGDRNELPNRPALL